MQCRHTLKGLHQDGRGSEGTGAILPPTVPTRFYLPLLVVLRHIEDVLIVCRPLHLSARRVDGLHQLSASDQILSRGAGEWACRSGNMCSSQEICKPCVTQDQPPPSHEGCTARCRWCPPTRPADCGQEMAPPSQPCRMHDGPQFCAGSRPCKMEKKVITFMRCFVR
jgi:hypothetical protein